MEKKYPFTKLFSRLQSKLYGTETGKLQQKTVASAGPVLKLLFFIIDWNQVNVISDVFAEEKVRFHFISKGRGTASNEILHILGIGAGDKAIIACLEQAVLVQVLMKEARKKLMYKSPGAGIAFTVPLSAINDPVLLIFKQSIHKNEKIAAELKPGEGGNARVKCRGGNMAEEFSGSGVMRNSSADGAIMHDLIISVVNQGYSDELMNTARAAGASGGTVINARGQAHEGAVKFFGISVQDEKELILILTKREKKVDIMQAICESHGLNTKAQGIVFSLPVDNVLGLSFE